MKKIFAIAFAALSFSAPAYSQYFPVDTAVLNSAYRELTKNPMSQKCQQAFFDAFPSTWKEFFLTYEYICDESYDLSMYSLAFHHLAAFEGMLSQIPDADYSRKLIHLSIGGFFDVDAPNYLQQAVVRYTLKKPEAMFMHLSTLTRGQQLRFWLFCWHTMLKKGKRPAEMEQLKSSMSSSRPEEVKIMEVAFEYSWGQAPHPPEDCAEQYPHVVAWEQRRR
jgi:hypothetical protein